MYEGGGAVEYATGESWAEPWEWLTSTTATRSPERSAAATTLARIALCGLSVPIVRAIAGDSLRAVWASELSRSPSRREPSPGATYTYSAAIASSVIVKNTNASRFRSERMAACLARYSSVSRKRYPTPRTVKRYSGSLGSRSIFSRRCRMCTSIVLGSR